MVLMYKALPLRCYILLSDLCEVAVTFGSFVLSLVPALCFCHQPVCTFSRDILCFLVFSEVGTETVSKCLSIKSQQYSKGLVYEGY